MKTYIVNIETRKGDKYSILGPFSSFEKARAAMQQEYNYWTDEKWKSYTRYGSSWDKGTIYTEEYSFEILERELK